MDVTPGALTVPVTKTAASTVATPSTAATRLSAATDVGPADAPARDPGEDAPVETGRNLRFGDGLPLGKVDVPEPGQDQEIELAGVTGPEVLAHVRSGKSAIPADDGDLVEVEAGHDSDSSVCGWGTCLGQDQIAREALPGDGSLP